MNYSEPLYEDRDRTGSCRDKEPVMQPGQVEGTIGVCSRDCRDEVHQEIIRGSHATTSGSVLGPVGQPNLREVDSVQSSKGRNNEDTAMIEPSHAAFIVGSGLGCVEQPIRKEESSRDCAVEIHEGNTLGSHATSFGSSLELFGQRSLREDESTAITKPSHAAIIEGSGLGCFEQPIRKEESSRDCSNPEVQQTGPRYSSDEAADGPFHKDNTKIKPPDLNTLPLIVLGMGPEFSSDPAGDGPDCSSDTEIWDDSD